VGTRVWWSAPQEWSTAYQGRGMYGLRDVHGKSHVIERDQIMMVGVTDVIEQCCGNGSHDCNSCYIWDEYDN